MAVESPLGTKNWPTELRVSKDKRQFTVTFDSGAVHTFSAEFQLKISPHELELMLFIDKNFLSPSIFDKVMIWAHSATAEGYKFDSPSYSTLKKQMNYTFPNTINEIGRASCRERVLMPV